ncbi:MAG TPA: hypothetical protein VE197_10760 [Mycobacterium sp.]|nr:hypothetical protein [Mycobacterium sp.]
MFYCVLALATAHLMRRHAVHNGLHMSVRELLDQLAGIEETVLFYHDGGKRRPAYSACSPTSTPPSSASPTCSTSTNTHPPADQPRAEPRRWVIHPPCSKTQPYQAKPDRQSPKAGNSR